MSPAQPPATSFGYFLRGLESEQLKRALADIATGFGRWSLWGTMRLHDIRQRYRRSINAAIIVLASHSEHLFTKMCRTAVLMEHARVLSVGPTAEVLGRYRERVGHG